MQRKTGRRIGPRMIERLRDDGLAEIFAGLDRHYLLLTDAGRAALAESA
jgi:hypothetical protein